LDGRPVQEVSTPAGEYFLVIEIPNQNRSQVEALVAQRGQVELVAHFPASDTDNSQGFREVTVITQDDIANVGQVQGPTAGVPNPHVPVVLTSDGAESFAQQMIEFGFTREGAAACPPDAPDNPAGYCLYTVLDGQVVHAASMSPDLADGIESGEFARSQNFVMTATNRTEARALQINLRAGALPAPLDLNERGTAQFPAPSLAQNFKLYSLITGLIAVLAVVLMVFLRYGNPVVAGPMIITALSEVVILLGFAALTGLALDLSHIAGLIVVIGTVLHDPIIIAAAVTA
jgi:preprotein translocase subunit SecD